MLGPTHLFQDVVPKYSLLKAYRSVLNLTHIGRILNDSLPEDVFRYIARQVFLFSDCKNFTPHYVGGLICGEDALKLRSLSQLFQCANRLSYRIGNVNDDVKKSLRLIPQGHKYYYAELQHYSQGN